jgi:hypothetical protein
MMSNEVIVHSSAAGLTSSNQLKSHQAETKITEGCDRSDLPPTALDGIHLPDWTNLLLRPEKVNLFFLTFLGVG